MLVVENNPNFKKYIDSTFPPNISSIYGLNIPSSNATTHINFKRLEDEVPVGTNIFGTGISPRDIFQGEIGDCQIVSCLSELARHPWLISRIFGNNHFVNNEGKFALTFYKQGHLCNVVVDSFLPFLAGSKRTYGIYSNNSQWCPIVLKGLAKLSNCYANLNSGNCFEAMMDITGFPASNLEIPNNDSNLYFEMLKRILSDKENLVTAGVDKSLLAEDTKFLSQNRLLNGLSVNHTYSVYDLFDGTKDGIFAENKEPVRLICLRNPQGHQFYCGKYSQSSNFWTPKLRQKFNYQPNKNDSGVVQVGFDDFRLFNTVSVCNASPNYKTLRHDFQFKLQPDSRVIEAPTFELVVHDGKLAYIGLHQKDKRVSESNKYIDMGAIVRKEGSRYVGQLPNLLRRESEKKFDLDPGRYKIYPFTTGVQLKDGELTHDCTLTVHSLSDQMPEFNILPFDKKSYDDSIFKILSNQQPKQNLNKFSIYMQPVGDLMLLGIKKNSFENDSEQRAVHIDPTHSTNVSPSIDSPISTMEPNQITFEPKDDMVVLKYARKNGDAFKFACSFKEGVLENVENELAQDYPNFAQRLEPNQSSNSYHFKNGRALIEY